MIPSAAANPTRPMPPSSSRPKHSAGLSVRSARSAAAGSGACGSRAGHGSWRRALAVRRSLPGCHLYSPPPLEGWLACSALSCGVGGRCGPKSWLTGPFGSSRHPQDRAGYAPSTRRQCARNQRLRLIPADEPAGSPGRRTGPGTTPGQTGWITATRAGSAAGHRPVRNTLLSPVPRRPVTGGHERGESPGRSRSRCPAIGSSLRPCRNPAGSTGTWVRPQIPGFSPGGLGPHLTASGFPLAAFPPVSRLPTRALPFVRLRPVSLRLAFSGSVPSAVAVRFGSPSVSLRGSLPLEQPSR